MAIKLEGAQLLLYRAAANADRGLPSAYETAVAKAACNQAGFEVAHEAMQIMGAIGYSRETLVEYCMRRCRGWMIAGGSVEMLKNRIAEHVFDRRFDQRPPRRSRRGGGVTRARLREALLAPQSVAIVGQSNDADQDRRPAAEISAAGGLRRPHLSDQSAARRACWASAPGRRSPRCRKCPTTPISSTPTDGAIEAVEECGAARRAGRDRARRRLHRGRRRGRQAREARLREICATHRHPPGRAVEPRRRRSAAQGDAHRQRRLRRARPAGRPHLRGLAFRQHDRRARCRAARRAASASPAWCRSATRSISRSARSARRRSTIPASTATCCSSKPCARRDALRALRAAGAPSAASRSLAYKLGRSAAARELAVSHTGALAGEDDVADAFLADCGIARVDTLEGLIEGLPLLARVPVRARGARRAERRAW